MDAQDAFQIQPASSTMLSGGGDHEGNRVDEGVVRARPRVERFDDSEWNRPAWRSEVETGPGKGGFDMKETFHGSTSPMMRGEVPFARRSFSWPPPENRVRQQRRSDKERAGAFRAVKFVGADRYQGLELVAIFEGSFPNH